MLMAYTEIRLIIFFAAEDGEALYSQQKQDRSLTVAQIQFSRSVMSDSLQPHGLQHYRLPCPSPTPRACSNPCPLSWWYHPTISSSVIPFSFCFQSFPSSGSFPMSQFLTSDDQSIGVSASASVLPMNIPDSFPLGLTGWISLQSRGLSRVFSNSDYELCIAKFRLILKNVGKTTRPFRYDLNQMSLVTPWTVAHQAPLSMGFPRQEYWSGLPFPSPEDLFPTQGEPGSPALQADSLPIQSPGKPPQKMPGLNYFTDEFTLPKISGRNNNNSIPSLSK